MTRIMPFGDSITSADGWRRKLRARLGPAVRFVGTQGADPDRHEGRSGTLVTDVAAADLLPGWLAASCPDVVLMHYGSNDIWRGTRTQPAIMAAYTALLDAMRAHNPRIRVLMALLLPMDPHDQPGCPARIVALNAAIEVWATANTTPVSPIVAVDHWTGFSVPEDTTDGVHPNDAGTTKIADNWAAALAEGRGRAESPSPERLTWSERPGPRGSRPGGSTCSSPSPERS